MSFSSWVVFWVTLRTYDFTTQLKNGIIAPEYGIVAPDYRIITPEHEIIATTCGPESWPQEDEFFRVDADAR